MISSHYDAPRRAQKRHDDDLRQRAQNRLALDMWALKNQPAVEFQAERLNRPDLPKGWNYKCSVEGATGQCSMWPVAPSIFENLLRIIGKPNGHDGRFKLHIEHNCNPVCTVFMDGFDHKHQFAIATLLRTYGIWLEIEFETNHPDASKFAYPRFPIQPYMPIEYQPCRAPRVACAAARTALLRGHHAG